MITQFLSNFTSIPQARIVLECLEVLAKHLSMSYFGDEKARDAAIDSAIMFLLSLKVKKDE